MKRLLALCLTGLLFLAGSACAGGLEDFLGRVNVQARADLPGFSAKISTRFGVPLPRVDEVLRVVADPADAFMVFRLGQMANVPPERVLKVYSGHKQKGWGAMAQELGIKPGSAEFKALKRGELSWDEGHGERSHHQEQEKEHGHGKEKGHH
ncbi:hypothetical protein JCM30471_15840 [Desulfuromonas carbonis]|uniref:hypothetical protein n=1 Tax=Desulfuromonas sp. DDH964 TaxID=1823759 RepID=UPI00078E3396|nr:hypothetical protein [Desulfuromonas sp. DDH964]AMV73175.1 hypothetical protein DBW_2866 [Desulfuromonas sp. DDH964]